MQQKFLTIRVLLLKAVPLFWNRTSKENQEWTHQSLGRVSWFYSVPTFLHNPYSRQLLNRLVYLQTGEGHLGRGNTLYWKAKSVHHTTVIHSVWTTLVLWHSILTERILFPVITWLNILIQNMLFMNVTGYFKILVCNNWKKGKKQLHKTNILFENS